MKKIRERHKNNVKIITSTIAIIFFWRGLRNLIDLYLFPEYKTISYIVSIFIGIILLYLSDNILVNLNNK